MTTIALSPEMEEIVNAKVQSRQFNSPGEVVRAGLQLLQEQDLFREINLEQPARTSPSELGRRTGERSRH